ncbi:hypothetical protein CN918_25425 [Priestia megaterium]|nr:hypothetical protein CN918_25425 [Priestia megaterium]
MRNFYRESRGDATQKIVVLAVIVVILATCVTKIVAAAKCAEERSHSSLWKTLFDEELQATCKSSGSDSKGDENDKDKNSDGSVDTGDLSTGGGSGSSSGGSGSGVGGSSEYGDGISMTDKELALPISHYESDNLDLTCSDTTAVYSFTIPNGTPPQGSGTKSISISNKKGWTLYMKVKSITTSNGLEITTDDMFYRKLSPGDEATFNVGWKWNVFSGYTSDLGGANVYFQVTCEIPPFSQVYTPSEGAPTNFKAITSSDSSISLSWDKQFAVPEYYVYRDGLLVYKGANSQYVDGNLLSGTKYTYKLFTTATHGTDTYSSASATTSGVSPIPPAPTNLHINDVSATTFHVAWTGNAKATHYRWYLDGKDMGTTPWGDRVQGSLSPNRSYNFAVAAENTYGTSAPVSINVKTNAVSTFPNPATFTQSNRTTSSFTVSWSPVAGAKSYLLRGSGRVIYSGTNTSVDFKNLSPGGGYHFYLYAISDSGISSSGVYTFYSALGYIVPTKPLNINISNITNTSMNLQWTKGGGATGTIIKMNGKEIYRGEGTNINISNLTPNTYYSFDLYSYNPSYTSTTYANTTTFTTNDTYDEIANLSATCNVENYSKTFTFPAPIKVGETGVFMLNLTNNSSDNITFNLSSIEKDGELFTGSTPVKLDYDNVSKLSIKSKETLNFPIRWILPSNAPSSYTQKTGTVTVNLNTSC